MNKQYDIADYIITVMTKAERPIRIQLNPASYPNAELIPKVSLNKGKAGLKATLTAPVGPLEEKDLRFVIDSMERATAVVSFVNAVLREIEDNKTVIDAKTRDGIIDTAIDDLEQEAAVTLSQLSD